MTGNRSIPVAEVVMRFLTSLSGYSVAEILAHATRSLMLAVTSRLVAELTGKYTKNGGRSRGVRYNGSAGTKSEGAEHVSSIFEVMRLRVRGLQKLNRIHATRRHWAPNGA